MARIKGFFTEGGKHKPVHARTLFGPAKSAEASARVHIDTPAHADSSVSWLDGEWRKAKSRERQVHLVEYANEAANRAGVIAENENVSEAQRGEARRVAAKYRSWVDEHKGKEMPSHNYPPDSPLRKQHYGSVRPDPVKDPPTSYNPEGGYQGWTNWDTWETKLLLDNDEQLARQIEAAGRNFLRKEQAGTFDREAARYYVLKYLVPQAKKQDPSIDSRKVDLGEIADVILRDARDSRKYQQEERKTRKKSVPEVKPGQYSPRFIKPVHPANFDESGPAPRQVFWRAEVVPFSYSERAKPIVLYGTTFEGQRVRVPFDKDPTLGSVEHMALVQGLGAGKVEKVDYFQSGDDWYEDHYGVRP